MTARVIGGYSLPNGVSFVTATHVATATVNNGSISCRVRVLPLDGIAGGVVH